MSINRVMGTAAIVLPSDSAMRGASGTFTPTLSGSVNPYATAVQGLDDLKSFNNIQMVSGILCPTAINGGPPYDDNIMFWPGCWGYDVSVTARITRLSDSGTATAQEVEILLCASVGEFSCQMYEMEVSVLGSNAYTDIVRWNGPLGTVGGGGGAFTALNHTTASPVAAVSDGWIFKATKVGSVLTILIDKNGGSGFEVWNTYDTASDTPSLFGPARYIGGLVGIGAWQRGGSANDLVKFGLSSITVTAP